MAPGLTVDLVAQRLYIERSCVRHDGIVGGAIFTEVYPFLTRAVSKSCFGRGGGGGGRVHPYYEVHSKSCEVHLNNGVYLFTRSYAVQHHECITRKNKQL